MSKLKDSIELMQLQCSHFSIVGMSHLGIEDARHPTATLLAFLKTGEANIAAVLGKDSVQISKQLRKSLDEPRTIDYMDFSSALDRMRWLRQGIVLHISIPTCSPMEEGYMKTDHSNLNYAFVYGDDYETALFKAKGFSCEAVDAQLALRRLMYVGSTNTLTAHVQGSSLLRRIKQSLTELFV